LAGSSNAAGHAQVSVGEIREAGNDFGFVHLVRYVCRALVIIAPSMIGIREVIPSPIDLQPNHYGMSISERELGETLTVLRFAGVVTMGGALAVVWY
jgi:hypothetical protein